MVEGLINVYCHMHTSSISANGYAINGYFFIFSWTETMYGVNIFPKLVKCIKVGSKLNGEGVCVCACVTKLTKFFLPICQCLHIVYLRSNFAKQSGNGEKGAYLFPFSSSDPTWRKRKIVHLIRFQTKSILYKLFIINNFSTQYSFYRFYRIFEFFSDTLLWNNLPGEEQ